MHEHNMADLNDELAMQKPFKLPEVETWRSPDAVRAQMAYQVLVEKALAAATALQVSIPDGWKLVPVEPTEEMILAAQDSEDVVFGKEDDSLFIVNHKEIYRAMLNNAPEVNSGKTD